jgi:hypothetical protein
MVTGAVNAGMTVVGGTLGNALRARYVASRGGEAALSWAQRAGAGLVEGAPDGFIGGFAGGFTDTALADGTFRDGLVRGFGRSLEGGLEGAALGTVLGGAVGASMSTARGPLRRGVPDGSAAGAGEVTIDELASVNNFGKPPLRGPVMASRGGRSVHTPRPEALRSLHEELQQAGATIRSDAEAQRLLDWAARVRGDLPENFHAVTLGDTIYVRPQYADNVRVLREELIHVMQQRGGMGTAERVAAEIEARLLMIASRHRWALTNAEVREMIREIRQMRATGRY